MKIPDNVLIIYDAPMESCCAYQFETGGYRAYISKHDNAYEVIRKALEYIEACEAEQRGWNDNAGKAVGA